MKFSLAKTLALTTALSAASIHADHASLPNDHAPISIMGDHTHAAGEWMLSYRYMFMDMDGIRSGDDAISIEDVFNLDGGYTVSPTNMEMDMHMFGMMYAPTDSLTLMVMAHYIETEMEHQLFPGAPMMLTNVVGGDSFTTESSGWGDLSLSALYEFHSTDHSSAHLGLGISIPTGSIDEEDNTPRPGMPPSFPVQQLPAPMQLGSGTFDLLPSITYVHRFDMWKIGGQARGVVRLEDENDNGYRLGHIFEAIGWAGYDFNESVGLTLGLSFKDAGELKGLQNGVGRMGPNGRSVTTAFGENYGGSRLDAIIGLNLYAREGVLADHRLAIDVRLPIAQDLNGIQLETDLVATVGWQKAW